MENLTLAQKLIKPHTIDPLEGHAVVVFETIGAAGEEYRFRLEPGDRVPDRTFFERLGLKRSPNYFAYAVNRDPQASTQITAEIRMDDQVHTFMLFITLGYGVADPRLLVTHRGDDPLRGLRDAAAGMFQQAFAPIDWDRVLDEFRDVERSVKASVQGALESFAASYGLLITGMTLAHRLAGEDQKIREERAQARIAKERATIQHDVKAHEQGLAARELETEAEAEAELKKKQRQLDHQLLLLDDQLKAQREETEAAAAQARRLASVADTIVLTLNTAIRNAGDSIRDPDALIATVTKVHERLAEIGALAAGIPPALTPGSTPKLLPVAGSQNGAATVIGDMLKQSVQVASLPVRRRLESAFLHLVGEVLLEDDADQNVVKQYKERLSTTVSKANLSAAQFEFFAKAATGDHVRDSLR